MREGSFLQQGSSARCCFVCYSTGAVRRACRCSSLHSCDLKFARKLLRRLQSFGLLTPSSAVDTDVSEKPAVLTFKGMSIKAATNLLGPQICRWSLFPTGLFLKTLLSIGQLTQPEGPEDFDLDSQRCENFMALIFCFFASVYQIVNLFGRLCMLRLWPSFAEFCTNWWNLFRQQFYCN